MDDTVTIPVHQEVLERLGLRANPQTTSLHVLKERSAGAKGSKIKQSIGDISYHTDIARGTHFVWENEVAPRMPNGIYPSAPTELNTA
jgi:mannosyltransferase OCH1-like enzyme